MSKLHELLINASVKKLCYTLFVINTACYTGYATNNEASLSRDPAENLFTTLFKKRRIEQLAAVKNLLAMDSYEKQYKMVSIITEKAFSVIQNSRAIIETSGYIPGVSQFPTEEKTLDALANVLENTALIGDIVLRLPDITYKILSSQQQWLKLYHWSLLFSNHTELLDKQSRKLIYLASQELNVTERDPDYVNPYRRISNKQNVQVQTKKTTKVKKRIKKGPRLSAGEL